MIGGSGNGERLSLKAALKGALARTGSADDDPAYAKALRAAAVSSFFEAGDMAAFLRTGSGEAMHRLRSDCVATIRGEKRLWVLRGRKRQEVFARWRPAEAEAREAIATMRVGEVDALARMIEQYATGVAPSLADQDPAELAGTEQVAAWLADVVPGVPPRVAVQCEIERRDLVRPFLELAGPSSHFAGRVVELDRLREHVGVLDRRVPPEAWLRRFTELLGSRRKLLPVVGIGGAGKSTLIAKFVLDHVLFDDPRQIPFVYLDLDRPSLDARDPAGLLLECARQLRAQYPGLRTTLTSLSESWRERLEQEGAYAADGTAERAGVGRMLPRLASDLADALAPVVGKRTPFLVVLDTFEEALYAGDTEPTRRLVEALERAFPTLRTVIAGRAELPPGFGSEAPLVLEAFDEPSAVEFVVARGVDRTSAAGLVRQVHRTPLLLRLAADLAVKESSGERGLVALRTRNFLFRVTDAAMASQLHTRILDHIHDDDVRRLAHPGLILRKITPDIIREILARACELDVPTRERAEELYALLRREVALVSEHDGALFHRKDVRSFTLAAMAKERPSQANALHRMAIEYYERRSAEVGDRAEELYHRLSLGQPGGSIEVRWVEGVERLILPNIEELPPQSRAFLARFLGRMPDDEAAAAANSDDRAALAARQARDALSAGDPHRVLEITISEARSGKVGPGMRGLEGEALRQLVRWREAEAAFSEAVRGEPDGLRRATLCAALAELAFDLGRLDAARHRAEDVLEAAPAGMAAHEVLSALTVLAAVDRLTPGHDRKRSSSLLFQAVRELDKDGALTTVEARRVASLIGDIEPEAVVIACRSMGASAWTGGDLALLAQALAEWDEQASRRVGSSPGLLARQAGAGDGDPDLTWSLFVANASHDQLAEVVHRLFKRTSMQMPEAAAFAEMFARRSPEWVEPAAVAIVEAYGGDVGAFRKASRTGNLEVFEKGGLEQLAREYLREADAEGMLREALRPLAEDRAGGIADVAQAIERWRKAARGGDVGTPGAGRRASSVESLRGSPLDLATAFYRLSVDQRLGIARNLGLVEDTDLGDSTSEISRLVLARAAERGMLAAVERALSGLMDD